MRMTGSGGVPPPISHNFFEQLQARHVGQRRRRTMTTWIGRWPSGRPRRGELDHLQRPSPRCRRRAPPAPSPSSTMRGVRRMLRSSSMTRIVPPRPWSRSCAYDPSTAGGTLAPPATAPAMAPRGCLASKCAAPAADSSPSHHRRSRGALRRLVRTPAPAARASPVLTAALRPPASPALTSGACIRAPPALTRGALRVARRAPTTSLVHWRSSAAHRLAAPRARRAPACRSPGA